MTMQIKILDDSLYSEAVKALDTEYGSIRGNRQTNTLEVWALTHDEEEMKETIDDLLFSEGIKYEINRI